MDHKEEIKKDKIATLEAIEFSDVKEEIVARLNRVKAMKDINDGEIKEVADLCDAKLKEGIAALEKIGATDEVKKFK